MLITWCHIDPRLGSKPRINEGLNSRLKKMVVVESGTKVPEEEEEEDHLTHSVFKEPAAR